LLVSFSEMKKKQAQAIGRQELRATFAPSAPSARSLEEARGSLAPLLAASQRPEEARAIGEAR
jgi:hypothetical protein